MYKAKILLFDIETAPILSYVWGIWDQNVGLNQISKDSHILSWAAKWHDPEGKINYPMLYADQRAAKDIENEKEMLKGMWSLLDAADIVITQNGKRFDIKRLNARFMIHGMGRPSNYRQIDTLQEAKKHFAFTSNKLEYLAKILKCESKKLTKRKFAGFELWTECLVGNKEAWKEMEKYNKQDVTVLEEVYIKLRPWIDVINFSVFHGENVCSCGSKHFISKGVHATNSGIFKRFKCKACGKPSYEKQNLLTPEKRKSLRK
jgi:hypothetical protein